MYVVMVTPEIAPAAKVGGLADVVHGLAREVGLRGNAVETVLPFYDCLRHDQIHNLEKTFEHLWVPFHEMWIHCDVYTGDVGGVRTHFIQPHSHHDFFNRGGFYGQEDDPARFAFFSRAALEFFLKSGRNPDVIHCHDWQTGLVPVLLHEVYGALGLVHPRVCYTLHNIDHQGVTGADLLRDVGLVPEALMHPDRMQQHDDPGAANLMKGGIVFANFVTTVSMRYAEEIRGTDLGRGLQGTLDAHARKLGGVVNGIDYGTWNPEIDPHIPCRYSVDNVAEKFRDKTALRHRLMLRDSFRPIAAIVSRLDRQKGVDLMRHALFYALANDCQFVLLGTSPDPEITGHFLELKEHLNENEDCHLEIDYDEELSHLIYAGADMMVVPSAFEPCGLTQMIAMRYGTVPVVRATGGLADTVADANHSDKPFEERTGYTFEDFSPEGLESAFGRAIGLWYRFPGYFHQLRLNGMYRDFSWKNPGNDYINVYEHIRAR